MNVIPLNPRSEPEGFKANIEAEAAYLGAVLIDNTIPTKLAAGLRPEHFDEPLHQRIYARALELIARGDAFTPATLKPYFDGDEALRELGGISYLIRLTADGSGLLAPRELAEQIHELAIRRDRHEQLAQALDRCFDLDVPLAEIMPADDTGEQLGRSTLPLLDLAALAKSEPKAKHFTIPGIAPSREVALCTGAGAVGKSLLWQQFATGIAAGARVLGMDLEQAPAIYLTVEDDAEQLHWRQAHLCRALGVDMARLAGKLHIASLRGSLDNHLAAFSPSGEMVLAPAYHRLLATMRATRARLVVLDNVAHLFAGNENDRGQVTAFVNLLNRAAGETGAAIVLLAHPNKNGADYSGSTAWLNAVRSHVTLKHAEGDEGETDPDVRVLEIGKPNYTAKGEALRFRWHDWAFVLEDDLPSDTRAELAQVTRANGENAAFLRCLAAATASKRAVSHNPGVNYAPAIFAKMPEGKGYSPRAFEGAFERLLHLGTIRVDQKLWQRDNRVWKFGIKLASECTDPPAPTPCTDPHRAGASFLCTDPHAPTPLYPTDILGAGPVGPAAPISLNGSAARAGAAEPPNRSETRTATAERTGPNA